MIGETNNWDKKFILKVQVLDCATCDNPLTDIAKITVEINDTPEPPDAIDNLRTIRENTASGTMVGIPLYTYDPEHADLNYEVLNMDYSGSPLVVATDGQMYAGYQQANKTNKFLNFELKGRHIHAVKVHDEPFYSIPGRLRVHLENVNESPQIELLKIPYAVQEDSLYRGWCH